MENSKIMMNGCKELINAIFEQQLERMVDEVRNESPDQKDKMILELREEIRQLKNQVQDLTGFYNAIKKVVTP